METRIDEIADGIYRLSTFVPEVAPPAGFTFNQFLVLGDEPLLFHTGLRRMFPLVRDAVARIMPLGAAALDHVRPRRGRRVRRDERVARRGPARRGGARADRLPGVAERHRRPRRRACSPTARRSISAAGRRVRWLDTPHVPHGWDAGVLYEEATGTLLCGDLFTQLGDGPALTEGDVVGPAIAAEDYFGSSSLSPDNGTDDPPARRPRAAHARADARPLLRRRRRGGAADARRRLRPPRPHCVPLGSRTGWPARGRGRGRSTTDHAFAWALEGDTPAAQLCRRCSHRDLP